MVSSQLPSMCTTCSNVFSNGLKIDDKQNACQPVDAEAQNQSLDLQPLVISFASLQTMIKVRINQYNTLFFKNVKDSS